MAQNYNRVSVYSHDEFDEKMYRLGIDTFNVAEEKDKAFISIIGTKECREYYLKEEDIQHWFKENTDNVINLDFDDIDDDSVEWNGNTFYGITGRQAKELCDFIENNIGKNFYIHCRAGKSRSQAVFSYIVNMYGEEYGYNEKYSGRKENPCLTPNVRVLSMLKREYYKKHNVFNIE